MKSICLLSIALSGAVSGACAETTPEPVMLAPAEPIEMQMARAPEPARPAARPRIRQTITLGTDAYTEPTPAVEGANPGTLPNDNGNVVTQPPVTYGVYGGYYGYDYGYGAGVYGRAADTGRATGNTGTPSPARTPPVGGDWPAVPSYGPKPMR